MYPHTIDNGAGERITFLRKVSSPSGDRLEIQSVVTPGAGPPMHVHHHQVEAMTVEQGRIGYRSGGTRPDPFDAAFLALRYRSEFALVDIPLAVQRFVFPPQVALGKLLGRYRKYANAPEPVRR